MGERVELDSNGNLHIGPFGRFNSNARITVDFPAADVDGIGLDIAASPNGSNERAAVKIGDFLLVQDANRDGTKDFKILDADGNVLFSAVAGQGNATLKTKYLDAVTSGAYHMEIDLEGLAVADLPAFVGGAGASTAGEKTAMYARANLLQTAAAAHGLGVGTRSVDGEHLAADTALVATLAAVPVASSLATGYTLATALGTFIDAHGDSTGVHFTNDTDPASGAGYTPVVANTDNTLRLELNALRTALATHFASGVA